MEPNTIEDLEIQKLFEEDELLDKEIETIDINELTTANAVVAANEIEKEANVSNEIANAQVKILLGIMFFFFAITPWISATCIKISLQNK